MEKIETWVSSSPQRKTQPEIQRENFPINVGDDVLIKGEEKNRGHWKIGIVNHLYNDKDNIIRVAQLRIGKKLIDRPIQQLYSFEFHCESITPQLRMRRKTN